MNTIGRDPSGLILDGLTQAIPEAAIGWTCPPRRPCRACASRSTAPPIRRRSAREYMRLRASVYAPARTNGRGIRLAQSPGARREPSARWLLDNRRKRPLIDASVESEDRSRHHDDDLRQDFAYTVILLTVEAA